MTNRLLLIFSALLTTSAVAQTSFDEKQTTASNVRLTVTNLGTFGNAFRGYRDGSGDPSCEYPAGSGIEHLFESGIWIGGLENGGNVRVSTSAYDAPQGYAAGRAGFEFTAQPGSALEVRSTLLDNPNYTPQAVSHQDYISEFSDNEITVPGTNIPIQNHINPMGVSVRMETYNWNYRFSDFFVIVNLVFTNNSQNYYDDTYLALWANTVVRNINITPAGSGGSTFYSQGGNGYIDSLNMAYCYDATGDEGFTDSYIAQKFLGAEDKYGFHHPNIDSSYNSVTGQMELDTDNKVHYNAWVFNNSSQALFYFPQDDNQRYQKMGDGLNENPCWDDPSGAACQQGAGIDIQDMLSSSGNRSDLLSVGPFRRFEPGDEIRVSFAFVLAPKKNDGNPNASNTPEQKEILVNNADWAQTAYNGEDVNFNGILDDGEDRDGNGEITRFILPSPPETPRTKVVPSENKIDIYWSDNSETSVDPITQKIDFEGYKIYLSRLGFDVTGTPDLARDFVLISQYDKAGNDLFYETGFDAVRLDEPVTFEGDTTTYYYLYTIENVQNGWQNAVAVTAFDEGNPESNLESLESSFLANDFRAFAGTTPNEDMDKNEPFVYPNPYYAGSSWEGRSSFQEESRKLIFANLPRRCVIRIYTSAGDFIDEIRHDENYSGNDIRWFETFGSENSDENVFSGGEHAWDLLSRDSQIISRGLYMFSVEDLETGEAFNGQFVIIK
ncbi:hypothetical protein [Phaeocystidibacter marisrubri]|uniref:Gliding motility-associated C-terminal domain-containing protein n=1 Tax=Phaeocystidibacter marisrubri TaxID=1577780 RepID=A0A6L3ZDH7_9FLAO|nr:hypothetical protein [Phaeocystidibacter marisrubri]KAB2815295.1 hypothetical protein F8C82_14480 [Phaeocystidibacter marisrubri]GGH71354.1 hypothetical protein GCM10011318_14280 [Phaeocystidibacter marisrubri]